MCSVQVILVLYLSTTIFFSSSKEATNTPPADTCSKVKTMFDINEELADSVSKMETWKSKVNGKFEEIKVGEKRMKSKMANLTATLKEQYEQIKTITSMSGSKIDKAHGTDQSITNNELATHEDIILERMDELEARINATFTEMATRMETTVKKTKGLFEVKLNKTKDEIEGYFKRALSGVNRRIDYVNQTGCVQNDQSENWQYIFGAKNGFGMGVYEAWINDTYICTDPTCLIYKNDVVREWRDHNIVRVRIQFVEGCRVVAWVDFNGTNSNVTNWFSANRLNGSVWRDIMEKTHNEFWIAAPDEGEYRRFYISNGWGGCPNDKQWMVVSEKKIPGIGCPWDNHESYPQFRYSKGCGVSDIHEMGLADWFQIFVVKA